ncbi:hypothetical protein B0H13DRAFT_2046623, partial [Mycena leptocephala]
MGIDYMVHSRTLQSHLRNCMVSALKTPPRAVYGCVFAFLPLFPSLSHEKTMHNAYTPQIHASGIAPTAFAFWVGILGFWCVSRHSILPPSGVFFAVLLGCLCSSAM